MAKNKNSFHFIRVSVVFLIVILLIGIYLIDQNNQSSDNIQRDIVIEKYTIPMDLEKMIYLHENVDSNRFEISLDAINNIDGAVVVAYRFVARENPEPTSGWYEIWIKEAGNWKYLLRGQDDPMCSELEELKIGKGINCYGENDIRRQVTY